MERVGTQNPTTYLAIVSNPFISPGGGTIGERAGVSSA